MMDKVTITRVILMFFLIGDVKSRIELNRSMRIIGGSVAVNGQFPHAVALILHLDGARSSFCGGSIIHASYVLTAAHCLDEVTHIEVRAGLSALFQTPQYQQVVEARDIRKHPQYNTNTLINDIGLLFLRQRIQFTNLIQLIALPRRTQENNRFVGDGTTIIGWGRWGNEPHQSLSDNLRFVSLPILPDRFCEQIYNQEYRFFNPTNICVSGMRGSSCGGDSGSAQHVTINGQMMLIGLVSYGSATCDSGHPPVMTRITSYLDWITDNTGIQRT